MFVALSLALVSACGLDSLGNQSPEPTASDATLPHGEWAFPPDTTDEPAPQPTGPPAVTLPDPSKVNNRDASAVALTVGVIFKSADANVDTSWQEAVLRASAYMTPELAGSMTEGRPRPGIDDDWALLAAHRAQTTASAVIAPAEDGQPDDTPVAAYRAVAVTISPHAPDGWRGEPSVVTFHLELTRATPNDPWKLGHFNESDPLPVGTQPDQPGQ
ncbi:MAG: hypothetical protein HOV68_15955 [Streptomycetaceae bacterium]|nr:hypothetical protein [Streptomycetaceae bacterium]